MRFGQRLHHLRATGLRAFVQKLGGVDKRHAHTKETSLQRLSGADGNETADRFQENGCGPDEGQTRYAAVFGAIGFAMWITFFSVGVLLDSTPDRIITDTTYRQSFLAKQVAGADSANSAAWVEMAKKLQRHPPRIWSELRAFLRGATTYTPVNLALLCFWAGFMGGASSRLFYQRALRNQTSISGSVIQNLSPTQVHYLGESPFSAALRSFVVYLVLLSGFYLAAGDPFKDLNSSQYLRLAGLVSCIAFAIGYDPSRFTDLINSLPKPSGAAPK
jgi:hypothetical protein